VRQLATDLRVNFNTVARAYRILDEAGVISTQQGRGTYVLEPPLPEDAKRMRDAALNALSQSYLHETHRLGFEPEEVEQTLLDAIAKWREEGSPPDENES
jgi:GntR family transcriptional regulator